MSAVGDQMNAPHEPETTYQLQTPTPSEKREARLHTFIDHRLDECGKCSFSAVLGFFSAIFGCAVCSCLLWRNVGAWLFYRNSYTVEFQSISKPTREHFYLADNGAAKWSTLSDVFINGRGQDSQRLYIPIPEGWDLAPSCSESDSVIESHSFNTRCIVLADGSAQNSKRISVSGYSSCVGLSCIKDFVFHGFGSLTSSLFNFMAVASSYDHQLQTAVQNGRTFYSVKSDKCYWEQILIVQCTLGHRFLDDPVSSPCVACEAGSYSGKANARKCSACPFGKTSTAGSPVCSVKVPAVFLPSSSLIPQEGGVTLIPGNNIGSVNLIKNYFLALDIFPLGTTLYEGSILHLCDRLSPLSHLPSLSLQEGSLRLRAVAFYGGMTEPVEVITDEVLKAGVWQRISVTVSTSITGASTITIGVVRADNLQVVAAPKTAKIVLASISSVISSGVTPDVQIYASSPTIGYGPANATIRDVIICESEAKCKCGQGQYLAVPEFSCTACNPGSYFPQAGGSQISCLPCSQDMYSARRGATACSACPSRSHAYGRASSCQCDRGSFKSSNATCTACGRNTYTAYADQPTCSSCPAGSSSDGGARTCRCAAGYGAIGEGATLQCVPCRPGEAIAMTISVNASTSTSDVHSPKKAQPLPGCSLCSSGSFSSEEKSLACSLCPINTVSSPGSTSCVSCPVNAEPDKNNPAECLCLPGFARPVWTISSLQPNACEALLFGLRKPDFILVCLLLASLCLSFWMWNCSCCPSSPSQQSGESATLFSSKSHPHLSYHQLEQSTHTGKM